MSNLAEIKDLKYDFTKSLEERFRSNLLFLKNPYEYKCGQYKVIIAFKDECDFESCLASGLSNSENLINV